MMVVITKTVLKHYNKIMYLTAHSAVTAYIRCSSVCTNVCHYFNTTNIYSLCLNKTVSEHSINMRSKSLFVHDGSMTAVSHRVQ